MIMAPGGAFGAFPYCKDLRHDGRKKEKGRSCKAPRTSPRSTSASLARLSRRIHARLPLDGPQLPDLLRRLPVQAPHRRDGPPAGRAASSERPSTAGPIGATATQHAPKRQKQRTLLRHNMCSSGFCVSQRMGSETVPCLQLQKTRACHFQGNWLAIIWVLTLGGPPKLMVSR